MVPGVYREKLYWYCSHCKHTEDREEDSMTRLPITALGLDERGELFLKKIIRLCEKCFGDGCETCSGTGLEYAKGCTVTEDDLPMNEDLIFMKEEE